MKIGIKVESTEKPERFAFNALPDGTTEISVNEDIQVITKATPIPDSEEVATEGGSDATCRFRHRRIV